MGILDSNTRVVDFVLTQEGRKLRSQGKLKFVYFSVSDDDTDYQPFISNSGSLTAAAYTSSVNLQIENSLVLEAVNGYENKNLFGKDQINIKRNLFTVPQGQTIVPKIITMHRTGTVELNSQQRIVSDVFEKKDSNGNVTEMIGPVVRGYERFNSSKFTFEYQYTPDSFPKEYELEGLLIKTYLSTSNGYIPTHHKFDGNDDVSFRNDFKIVKNQENNNLLSDRKKNK